MIFTASVVAFILLLLENQSVNSYDFDDETKFTKRHSVEQLRRMMLALNVICLLVNFLLGRNLTQMVSRPNRALGSTKPVHYVALGFTILASLLLVAVIVAAFFPTVVHLYQKL